MAARATPRLPVAPDLSKAIRAAFAHHALQHQDELVGLLDWCKSVGCWPLRTVLEIGSHTGGTLACWATLAETVVAVDMPATCGLTTADFAARDLRFAQDYPDIWPINGNSHDPATVDKVRGILAGDPVDLLFIDGDHSRWGVEADYENYCGFCVPGSVIAFHDTNDSERNRRDNLGVHDFVATLPNVTYFSVGADWGGIGAIVVD